MKILNIFQLDSCKNCTGVKDLIFFKTNYLQNDISNHILKLLNITYYYLFISHDDVIYEL